MGAQPYWYFVKYEPDVNNALEALKQQEFKAGRYNPVVPFLDFPIDDDSPCLGPQHSCIAEALEDAAVDGTRSILDVATIAEEPDFCVAAPLDEEILLYLYKTTQPTREMVEKNMLFFDSIERGHCIYIIIYKNGRPDEILFAGYSFD